MLKLKFIDSNRNSIWLVRPKLRIGRGKDNDIILKQPGIKAHHAEIRLKKEQLYLLNLHPENIVGYNGRKVKNAVKIGENDVIQLAKVKLKVIHPSAEMSAKRKPEATDQPKSANPPGTWGLQATASWASQSFYPVKGTAFIGRDATNDISVPVSHLSRKHAQLTVSGSYLVIKDLGSTNGTFLNGERITQGRASPGDKVRFDVVSFTVTGPQIDVNQTIVRPSELPSQPATKITPATPVKQPAPTPAAASAPAPAATGADSPPQEVIPSPPSTTATTKNPKTKLYKVFALLVVIGACCVWLLLS